jgi:ketosteroid isomerase-like protein
MAQQNVHLVVRTIERWNAGEMVVPAAFDPDVEWLPRRAATEGAYRGIEGMESFAADTREAFETFQLHLEEVLDLGERVLACGTIRFRAKQSGLETEIPFGGLVEFRDGKIARWEDFGSREAALEAAERAR